MDPKPSSEPAKEKTETHRLGTTMRIDLSPEMREQALRNKPGPEGRRSTQPIITIPRPRSVTTASSLDFQQLLQNIYDAALITNLEGEIVMTNVRANQFFLAKPGEMVHASILSLIGGAEASLLPTILETLKANRFVLMQAYCLRLDGTYFAAEISVNPLRLGTKDHLSFFIRDITLRKEQEDRLRTGYTALQNSSSGIIVTGPSGSIEYWNPAFLSLFGLTEAIQAEGHDVREFFRIPAKVDEVIAAVSVGGKWSGELEMQRPDGATFFGQASVTANQSSDGDQVGLVFSVLDVTPEKRAQQQLQAYATQLRVQNQEMHEDLNIAQELHRAFLPTKFQSFPQDAPPGEALLQVRNLYCPSGTIGGDFYDLRALSPHEVAMFISDVMGHGIRSALVVATIRGLIEQLRPLAGDPGAFLTQLNSTYTTIFKELGGHVIFSTAFYGVIDLRTGEVRCANAGHPRPYVLRRREGRPELLTLCHAKTAALGIFPDARFETCSFQLGIKDLLLLYTDGLAEAEGPSGELFDVRQFEHTLERHLHSDAGALLDALIEDAKDFSGASTFEDDVCLLALELERLATI